MISNINIWNYFKCPKILKVSNLFFRYVLILTGASQLSKKFESDDLNALYLL